MVSSAKRAGTPGDGQVHRVGAEIGGGERAAVERNRDQFQFVAVEYQRRGGLHALRIAHHCEPSRDQRVIVTQVDIEVDRLDQKIRRGVVLEVDGFWLGVAHGLKSTGWMGGRDAMC